jgi:hypothetical protein
MLYTLQQGLIWLLFISWLVYSSLDLG